MTEETWAGMRQVLGAFFLTTGALGLVRVAGDGLAGASSENARLWGGVAVLIVFLGGVLLVGPEFASFGDVPEDRGRTTPHDSSADVFNAEAASRRVAEGATTKRPSTAA